MAFDRVRRDKIRKTVILDSSAILSFFEYAFNWQRDLDRLLGSYQLVVPSAVVKELEILATQKTAKKLKAQAALKLISHYEIIDQIADTADEAVLKIAEKTKGIVITNDMMLREQLQKRSLAVIFLRGKKRLALDE
jgi:uncharacterized protein